MRWRSRSSPAIRCISASRCMSRRMASATSGADAFVVENGTHFTNLDWLPAIGYQRNRELSDAECVGRMDLPAAPAVPSLDDTEARRIRVGGDPIDLRGDRGDDGGSDRRCAGGAAPHVDGRRATLLPLRHGCPHQQRVRGVLRQLRGARRTVDTLCGRVRAGRRDSDLPSPGACRESGPHGPKRTSLARSTTRGSSVRTRTATSG